MKFLCITFKQKISKALGHTLPFIHVCFKPAVDSSFFFHGLACKSRKISLFEFLREEQLREVLAEPGRCEVDHLFFSHFFCPPRGVGFCVLSYHTTGLGIL